MEYPIKHELQYDNLFANGRESALTIFCTASESIKRGCLVKYDTTSKKIAPVKAKADEVFGVAGQDIEAEKSGAVFLNGEFNESALSMGTPSDSGTVADFFLSARKVNIIFRKIN